ncbi:MAG: hypothetical protein A2958_02675 [Candidatus Levybacteria bacterium RIFCSPLOWO2_01_FULL_38_13]|nr:MAG: hypothetical protein A2629_03095 [Candidatus Levybacteria bacterium RIFCSPHIGHO2_01_FULL_41_15]OGH35242.1 MAG: hypothetical protein A2958_02675 [Candidatus Levybacteria bacterium RIFCSPLOWO2_01_FULL_38_13]
MIDATPPEGQPRERVIELNEWFTPFENYDSISYDEPEPEEDPWTPDEARFKTKEFQLANVGKFSALLLWEQQGTRDASSLTSNYLLVLPASERLIRGKEFQVEQEKMETRPMLFDIKFMDEKLMGQAMPFGIEMELPSGQITEGRITPMEEVGDDNDNIPSAFKNWNLNGEKFAAPMIPETANIINRCRIRFVPR